MYVERRGRGISSGKSQSLITDTDKSQSSFNIIAMILIVSSLDIIGVTKWRITDTWTKIARISWVIHREEVKGILVLTGLKIYTCAAYTYGLNSSKLGTFCCIRWFWIRLSWSFFSSSIFGSGQKREWLAAPKKCPQFLVHLMHRI